MGPFLVFPTVGGGAVSEATETTPWLMLALQPWELCLLILWSQRLLAGQLSPPEPSRALAAFNDNHVTIQLA